MSVDMQVTLSHSAEIQLGSMDEKDRQRVLELCGRLKNWKSNRALRAKAAALHGGQNRKYIGHAIRLNKDAMDLTVFFVVDEQHERIEVADIIAQEVITAIGQGS